MRVFRPLHLRHALYLLGRRFLEAKAKNFELKAKSFAIDFEITIHLGMKNALCSEVPIEYNPRTYEKGKKIKIIDGLKSFNIIIKYIIKKFLLNSI